MTNNSSVNQKIFDLGIGDKIKELRIKRGMTQEEFAEKAGFKQPTVSLLEGKNYVGYTLQTLKRVALALNADLKIEFVKTKPEKNSND